MPASTNPWKVVGEVINIWEAFPVGFPSAWRVPVLLGLLPLRGSYTGSRIAVWSSAGAGLRAWRRLLKYFLLEGTVLKSWSGEGSYLLH